MDRTKIIFPRASRLLKDIDDDGFAKLCACLNVRELRLFNKQLFISESDPCDRIGLVALGGVRLSRLRLDGGRSVLENVPPGDVFGTTYAFRDADAMGISASAVGETVVLMFDTSAIVRPNREATDVQMTFVRNLFAVMSQKTFQMKQKLRILSKRTIRERVLLTLQICAKRAKSNVFDIPFDRQALADYLCVDRCALSAELSKLQNEGRISFVKNHFQLLAKPKVQEA